jgi:N-carbamoyl-L-amino-acid hydrolase
MTHIHINPQRLMDDLLAIAQFTEPDTPGWTRRFPSDAYKRSRTWLRGQMEAAGLHTWLDAVGNCFGVLNQTGFQDLSGLKPIISGSHTDTVMGAGRYDGMLGVLGALEAARAIRDSGTALRHPLVVADYLSEEATDYAIACMGSMVLATSDFKSEWLSRTVRDVTLWDAIIDMGGSAALLSEDHIGPLMKSGDIAASLELHIEQGPVLEAKGARLAAVSGIVGIRRAIFELAGKSNHAGGTPMDMRHDAVAALGQLIVSIEEIARRHAPNGNGAVGTIGKIEVKPNQGNVIANRVTTIPELRSLDMVELDAMWAEFMQHARQACDARGVTISLFNETRLESVRPPAWLHEAIFNVCQRLDPRAIHTPSGAGHDTNYLARIAPAAMIFVPSVDGRSHAPEEHTDPADLALGVQALANAIVAVDAAIP